MARTRNPIETTQITLSTTPLNKAYLEALVEHGMYGKNPAEAAERLISSKLSELSREETDVAKSLSRTWQRYRSDRNGEMR